MRIRKRPVPLPLSSLSPVPISDPLPSLNLNRPPPLPVVVQLCCDPKSSPNPHENPSPPAAHARPQPSDRPADHLPPLIGKVSCINGCEEKNKEEDRLEELLQEEDESGEEKGNNFRKENLFGAKAVSGFPHESSSNSPPVLGRWCEEGERAFPPKKRRGLSYERSEGLSSDCGSKTGSKITKAKTNSSKKSCSSSITTRNNYDDFDHVDNANKQTKTLQHNNKKARGGALMQGSRCSRVNGRGWRCCQQTLVGYSLCEHHLGKGRLRSMTSVRSRSLAKSSTPPPPPPLPPSQPKPANADSNHDEITNINKRDYYEEAAAEEHDEDDNTVVDEVKITKPLMAATASSKKRVKLGMVKARSISSLLGQTSGAISMADLGK